MEDHLEMACYPLSRLIIEGHIPGSHRMIRGRLIQDMERHRCLMLRKACKTHAEIEQRTQRTRVG